VEKREKEIELQKTELAKKDAVLKQKTTQRNALITGIILLLLFVVIVLNAYRHRRKTGILLKAQKDEIETQAEELEIKNAELEKLSIVASETDNAIVIASATGDIEWVNDAFTGLYGYSLKEFKEKKGKNLIEASTNPKIKILIEKAISEKASINYITNTTIKSGLKLWVQTTLTPIIDESGNITKIVAIDSDITEIKKAEKRINEQKEKIEEQNLNITDSIVYAQRIQRALLPPGDYMKQLLPHRFILYKPRNIVSGDFYWVNKKNDLIITAAADCTGHGVPGAMMSMLGVSILNEIVSTLQKPDAGDILNNFRSKLIESLHQGGKESHMWDGIDIALCLIDLKRKNVQYAGAYSPLYLIREGKLKETKGDKMPIGIHARMEPFTNHNIQIQTGDSLYIFSDGYADQFGGDNDKRFTQRRFRKLLVDIHDKPMTDQKDFLEKTLEKWRGKSGQIDDILVMGVRV
jgi:PAS domain S-box-containing protein